MKNTINITLKNKLTTALLFSSLMLALVGCKKEDDEEIITPPANPVSYRSSVELQPNHQWGSEGFELNTLYTINGVDVSFTEVRFYLSNFQMSDMMNTVEEGEKAILLSAADSEGIQIAATDLEHVHGLQFMFGLDSITNHADPTIASAPLNDPLMHWGWNPDSGYKFLKVEGSADINSDGNMVPFSIHAATDALRRDLSAMLMSNLAEGVNELQLNIDYAQMFEGVDFANLSGTHGASDLTNGIADNIQNDVLSFE